MVKVSEEIKDTFTVQRTIPMATVNNDGVPNVIYVGMWWWENSETICVVNNYLRKTLANIESNGWVSFVSQGKNGSYQIKCRAENLTQGPLFEKARKRATEQERPLPGRSVVVCTIEEVYQASSGSGAGDKLA